MRKFYRRFKTPIAVVMTLIVIVCMGSSSVFTNWLAVTITGGQGGTEVGVGASGTLLTADFMTEVAKGNVPGHSLVRKFGSVEGLAATTDTDVWEYATLGSGTTKYTFSPDNGTIGTADITLMSSSSAADTLTMTIEGLIADGSAVSQDVILTGQTQKSLTTPLWRVNRVYNSNGTSLAGNVYIYTTGTVTAGGVPQIADQVNVRAYVNLADQQTLQGPYTVPLHCNAYIVGLETSITQAGNPSGTVNTNCKGIVREFGKQFRTQDEFDLIHRGGSSKNYNFPIPLMFPPRSDFIPQVNTNTATTGVSWSYTILLVEDGF